MTDTHTEALVGRVARIIARSTDGHEYYWSDHESSARECIEAIPARNDERALKLVEALTAQASAELLRCGCTECDGEGDWTHCSVCSVHFGRAIDLRSAALADTQPSGETR